MKRSPSAVSGRALKAFRRRKVMTLEEVAELVDSSIHTARRRLKEWRAHTSYNQNGRYYTLPDVPEAVERGESFDQVERRAWNTVIQLGAQTLQLFLSLQGDGDLGQRVVTDDGKTLHRSETKSTTPVRSIFGEHSFEQYTYSPGKNKAIELRPISVRIVLPEHCWSLLLQEFSQMFCVDQAFNQSSTNLSTVLGGKFSIDTLEKINQQMGELAGEYLDNLPNPDPNTEAKFLVAQADGKGVPLIKKDVAKVAAFEAAKKRPGNRKMATVASVYTVDPHILHALAYVWEAAGLFCSTESDRKAFTRSRLLRILRGEVAGVIRGLRQMGTRRDLKGDKLKSLKRICNYLEKNQDRMRYDEYLRRGYPIATGVIEGACRHLVKDRMERSGMRWTLAGARNMLNVRAAFQSDHWRPFLDSCIQKQTAAAQQHRNLIADYTPLTLSC